MKHIEVIRVVSSRRYSLSRTQCLTCSTKDIVELVVHQIHVNDVAPRLRAHMETSSVKQTLTGLTRDVLSQNVCSVTCSADFMNANDAIFGKLLSVEKSYVNVLCFL